jgi:hypothetical protein
MEITYRFEFHPNPAAATLHLSERLTEEHYAGVCTINSVSDADLLGLLSHTVGVEEASIYPWHVFVVCGKAFDRRMVLAGVLDCLKMWLEVRQGIKDATWTQLPDIGGTAIKRETAVQNQER